MESTVGPAVRAAGAVACEGWGVVELAIPEAMVADVAAAARDELLLRDALAGAAYRIGCRHVQSFTPDWVGVAVYGDTWPVILRAARAWASGQVHLGADVGELPLPKRGAAVMRRLARHYGCAAAALWYGLLHAYIARCAWWLALHGVAS